MMVLQSEVVETYYNGSTPSHIGVAKPSGTDCFGRGCLVRGVKWVSVSQIRNPRFDEREFISVAEGLYKAV
jgi:hypothetical protein